MLTDWKTLAVRLDLLGDDGSERGGDSYAEIGLDEILGNEWIANTVEHIISFKPGRELAMNCLRHLHSSKATNYAYEIYKSSDGERASQAVWLIKHIANPIAYEWIEEFLNDNNVIGLGVGVLDQLLWTEQIPYDDKAKSLLNLADKKSNGQLTKQTDFIRQYAEAKKQS